MHPDKRVNYISELRVAQQVDFLPRDSLNSLAHKMIYCSCIIIRMRPWLFPIFRCLHARYRSARAPISAEAREAFAKCELALAHAEYHFLPFAAVESFPSVAHGLKASYADAADDKPGQGWGFWWVSGSVCFLAWGVWETKHASIPIHGKEAWASTAAIMTMKVIQQESDYVLEYTDNSPTEWVVDSQQSKCEFLQTVIEARAEFFDASGMCSLPQRVSSANNVWADFLSRGWSQYVLWKVAKLGLKPIVVPLASQAELLLEVLAELK